MSPIEKHLDLSNKITKDYVDRGFYVDNEGYIYDTTFKPGDKVRVIGSHFKSKTFSRGKILTIESIRKHDVTSYYGSNNEHERRDIHTYQRRNYEHTQYNSTYVNKSLLKFVESSNKVDPKHFELVTGAPNMTALEYKKPTLVRELKETITTNGSDLTEVGEFIPFDSVSSARNYVTAKIREAVRARNDYPQFRIYTQDSVALAEEPVVTFK